MTNPPVHEWSTILGKSPRVAQVPKKPGLWFIVADDGRGYFLKEQGPWRNGASLVDEYRVLRHISAEGLTVAPQLVTDSGRLLAGDGDVTYYLIPQLPSEEFDHELEPTASDICRRIGTYIGRLHATLSTYPWAVESFQHDPALIMQRDPTLEPRLVARLQPLRESSLQRFNGLPQLANAPYGWRNTR